MIKPKFTDKELKEIRQRVFDSWDYARASTQTDIARIWVEAVVDEMQRRGDDYVPADLIKREQSLLEQRGEDLDSLMDIYLDENLNLIWATASERQRALDILDAYKNDPKQLPLKPNESN